MLKEYIMADSVQKVLFVNSEMEPYLPQSPIASLCRQLPQGIQERRKEIRAFMPKYGCINERKNQLHEVIRLSGMNIIISDVDRPLIIKVASISAARLQEHVDEFCWKYSHRGGDEMAELLLDVARAPHVPLSRIRSVRGPMEAHPAVREPGFRANHRLRKGWEDGERDRRPPILGRIASVLQGAAIRRLDEELAETERRLSGLVPAIEGAIGLPDSLGRVA